MYEYLIIFGPIFQAINWSTMRGSVQFDDLCIRDFRSVCELLKTTTTLSSTWDRKGLSDMERKELREVLTETIFFS